MENDMKNDMITAENLRAAVNATVTACIEGKEPSYSDDMRIALDSALSNLSGLSHSTELLCRKCKKETVHHDLVGYLLAESVNDQMEKQRASMELTVLKVPRGERVFPKVSGSDFTSLHSSDPENRMQESTAVWQTHEDQTDITREGFYMTVTSALDGMALKFNAIAAFQKEVKGLVEGTLTLERKLWQGAKRRGEDRIYVYTPVLSTPIDWYVQGRDAVGWYFHTILNYVTTDPTSGSH